MTPKAATTSTTAAPEAETHMATAGTSVDSVSDARDDAPVLAGNGILYALAAYGLWGLFPVFFKQLESVPPLEVLMHRVIWSVVFLAALVLITRRGRAFIGLLKQPSLLGWLTLSAVMMSLNWLIFIWAVSNERILETSLGYFLNPIISIFLGMLFLAERLRPGQWLALGLAGVAVGWQLLVFGNLPLVALGVAFTFGFYGLLRKRIAVESILGLFLETLILLPIALLYLLWLYQQGQLWFGHQSLILDSWMVLSGVVTSVPLLLFAAGARRLPLMMMGFLQYLVPSISFTIAVAVYHEPVDSSKLITFVLIWMALLVLTLETLRFRQLARRI